MILTITTLWVVVAAGYLVLAGHLVLPELVAALSVSAAAVLLIEALKRGKSRSFRIRAAWLLPVLSRVPVNVLRDSAAIGVSLVKSALGGKCLDGSFVRVPFEGAGRDPYSAGRRALITAAISVSPNTIAVKLFRKSILVHRLTPPGSATAPADSKWPL